jgi:hypothetical protein
LLLCLQVSGIRDEDASACISDQQVHIHIRKRSHRRLRKLLNVDQLQFVNFNPYYLPDQDIHVAMDLPSSISAQEADTTLSTRYLHGFLVITMPRTIT